MVAYRACRPTRGREEPYDEVRYILRATIATTLGAAQRVPALSKRARSGRARRSARLRLCLGGRAPLPRGVLALARTRGVPRGGEPAHPADPPGARHHA